MIRDKTLLSLAAVSILFFALLVFTFLGSAKTERLCGELLTFADQCLASVRSGKLSDAETQLSAFRTCWDTHRLFFSATQPHADIDAVNAALDAASLQLFHNCTDEFYAEIADIRNSIEKIRDVQRLNLENIL